MSREREFHIEIDVLDHKVWFDFTQKEILEDIEGTRIDLEVVTPNNSYSLEYRVTFPGGVWSDVTLTPTYDVAETPLTDEAHFSLDTDDPEDRALLVVLDGHLMRRLLADFREALREPWEEDDDDDEDEDDDEDDEETDDDEEG